MGSKAGMKKRTVARSPAELLLIAAVMHVAMTVTVFMVGRKALLPYIFDTNGTAVSFVPRWRRTLGSLKRRLRGN